MGIRVELGYLLRKILLKTKKHDESLFIDPRKKS